MGLRYQSKSVLAFLNSYIQKILGLYVYHMFGANHLTGVQMDIFVGEND